ncbi:D-alanyl-D-alanine carboxypeptidase family protein [Klugiella xanthotipulae]|nr:D-alanyl-D-alanine carboxypeptidase [Klugiella xanthotipulae]
MTDYTFDELVRDAAQPEPGDQPSSGQSHTRRKRRWVAPIVTIATLTVLAGSYVGAAAAAPLPAPLLTLTANTTALTATAPTLVPVWPTTDSPDSTGAVSLIGNDLVVSAEGADTARPMASLSKVVTALVVLKQYPLAVGEMGPTITFTSADMASYNSLTARGGVVLPVAVGQSLTQRELMTGMMLNSANNYAETLARWAFGSLDQFLAAASTWLAEQELNSISMADPHGMSPLNVASANDLVRLGKLSLENPFLSATVSMSTATIPIGGELANTNVLLGSDGFRGIKTGTTSAAGYCVMFARDLTFNGVTTTSVGVILGADSHYLRNSSAVDLAHSVERAFSQPTLVSEGDEFGHLTTAWGDKITITAADSLGALLWNGATVSAEASLTSYTAVPPKGDVVGKVQLRPDPVTQESTNLVTAGDVTEPGLVWRLTHPAELWTAFTGG